jgi:hypothetical protein
MTSLYSDPRIALRKYGLCRSHPMAGNGTDRGCGMAGGLPEANKTRCWILAISSKQCSLDALGLACASLRADRFANLSRGDKYSRRAKERSHGDQHAFRLDAGEKSCQYFYSKTAKIYRTKKFAGPPTA